MSTQISRLADELLRFLLSSEEGYSDQAIRQHFGGRYEQLATAINELLSCNRLQLFNQNNSLLYKAIKEETAQKFEGLGPEQILVYQAIERSGNKGIWTRDIKVATNIPQHSLTKTLKILEQRMLIKSVRSVVSKSKKLFMLYDVVPAKEITGGPWYSDQEFDHEFVNELGNFIVQVVKNLGMADINTIHEKVRISGISKVELSSDELELVVNTLVYDYRLEEVQASVLLLTGHSTSNKIYKVCKPLGTSSKSALDFLTGVPCGVCTVVSQCCEGGIVSPSTCQYYLQWLSSLDEIQNVSSIDKSFNW